MLRKFERLYGKAYNYISSRDLLGYSVLRRLAGTRSIVYVFVMAIGINSRADSEYVYPVRVPGRCRSEY